VGAVVAVVVAVVVVAMARAGRCVLLTISICGFSVLRAMQMSVLPARYRIRFSKCFLSMQACGKGASRRFVSRSSFS
jgi:hypothetical protein